MKTARFNFGPGGIYLQSQDDAQVALLSLVLRPRAFSHFRCVRGNSLHLNMADVCQVLQCAKQDVSVTLTLTSGLGSLSSAASNIEFLFENPAGERTALARLKRLHTESEHLYAGFPHVYVPELDYLAIVRMPTAKYREIFTHLGGVGGDVFCEASGQSVEFSVVWDGGEVALNLTQTAATDDTKEGIVKVLTLKPVKIVVQSAYLAMFAKACPVADNVSLYFLEKRPLRVQFSLPEEHGYLRYDLAPLVEDEDGG